MKSLPALAISALLLILQACGTAPRTSPPPTAAEDKPEVYVTAISAGAFHMCQLTNQGEVSCWGNNSGMQLGDGTYKPSNTPVSVPGLSSDIIAIDAGGEHTCALTVGGEVKCWGSNNRGQLGDGTILNRTGAVDVIGLDSTAVAISAGDRHTCAVLESGAIKCWGQGVYGRLGDGKGSARANEPVDAIGLGNDMVAVSAGDQHTCGLTKNGGIWCWGKNGFGELGIGDDPPVYKQPIRVMEIEPAVTVMAGYNQTCDINAAGNVLCWGWNGILSTISDGSAQFVRNVQNATALAMGSSHACALTADSQVYCWGSNEHGQLGKNPYPDSPRGVRVDNLHGHLVAISAGYFYTCVLSDVGEIQCWGSSIPGQPEGSTNVRQVGSS